MKISELIKLDCREEKNVKEVDKVLRKIEPLAKKAVNGKIELESIEKLVWLMRTKYDTTISGLSSSNQDGSSPYYVCSVSTFEKGMHLTSIHIYGCSLYDLWSKIAIYMWGMIQNGKVQKK